MAHQDVEESENDNTKFKDGVNRNARLIIRNVSFKATEDSLREYFSSHGNVEEVKLLKKPDGKLVGCGFVHYTHVDQANKAIAAANKKPFLGRPLYVAWAVPKHKYGNDKQEADAKYLHATKTDYSKITIKNGIPHLKEPETPEEVTDDSKPSKDDKNKVRINRNARLIVRNVSFKATEQTLREHFESYGTIEEVKLLTKPDGKLVGCAFVHFKNVPMAKKALLNTNMKPFLGRPISVDWAVAKNKYMQHVVNQQLELQDDVKKEDLDSDGDDGAPVNISDDVKHEVKSESDSSSTDEEDGDEDDERESKSDESESDDDEEDEEVDQDADMDDTQSQASTQPERQRIKLNDAEDGCTVFITNIPFSVDSDQLRDFAETTGRTKYALICMDKMTEHSKGSGFVKFETKEDTDRFLALPPDQLKLEGQVILVKPALKRESLQKASKKEAKDNRNLYLVKEGVVVAGTKAAVGVSASDMSKRLALERSKTQMLKNLNRFVSRYRIVVSNLPPTCDDGRLRRICADAAGKRATLTEARVMRDLRAPLDNHGKHPSKGYGFVMFTGHEDALNCLRKLNNNPDIFDKNNRPIVSFSIEDRTALNARKKRLEKSIANNPVAARNAENNEKMFRRNNRKRKNNMPPDESYVKKGRFDKKINQNRVENSSGKFVKRPQEEHEFTGLTSKEGTQHNMRSNQKLRTQQEIHRQNVKMEKKKSGKSMRFKMAAKERVKQPKQKVNKNKNVKRNKKKSKNIVDFIR